MKLRTEPGTRLEGEARVPGDKSIGHRWLILGATATGPSRLRGLPGALDVRSTAGCLAALTGVEGLAVWAAAPAKDGGDLWHPQGDSGALVLEGVGWSGLREPNGPLDCGNSGTSMRMLAGVAASGAFATSMIGDASLSSRPMERVAEPLRSMGATFETTDGHAPITVRGGSLRGITYALPVRSAQVKSAVLLAALTATGETVVTGVAGTRDHTERALAALGAPVRIDDDSVSLTAFQHEGFEGDVPGDPSSAAFVLAAAAVTGSNVAVRDVGLNPSRTAFVDVLRRMGVHVREKERWASLGEPAGVLEVEAGEGLSGVVVAAAELPALIDEVPVLAAVAAHASGESRFEGAGELRLKESDRLTAMVQGLRALGTDASVDGDALVVAGGGVRGGTADGGGDHRIAMSLAVAAMGATSDCFIEGMESADISFPGFVECLVSLGARAEPA
jgi:3-phosphoshikimate 1-carboxyvinyltransferase